MDRVDALTGLALLVGLLLVVLVESALTAAGLETAGTLAYPIGYGILVLTAWHVWIRPLDLRGPDSDDEVWRSDVEVGYSDDGIGYSDDGRGHSDHEGQRSDDEMEYSDDESLYSDDVEASPPPGEDIE